MGYRKTQKPIFLGLAFPYAKGPEGIPATLTDREVVKADYFLLLTTRKRERVMLPTFGVDLERLVFENTGPLLRAKAFREIADATANWEPRVSLTNVAVEEKTNLVDFIIYYEINGFPDVLTISITRDNNGQ